MTLRKRLISLCMVMVLVFSLSAVCASAAQEAVAEQPTVSMSFDLDNRVKHEKTVRLPDGSIAKITAEPINTGRALSGVWKITGTNGLATMEYWIELEKAGLYTNALLRILWRRKQCKYGLARTERLLGQSVSYPDFTRKTGFQKYFGKGKC